MMLIIYLRHEELKGQITERNYESESRRKKEKEELLRERDEEREYDRLMKEEQEKMRELGFVPKVNSNFLLIIGKLLKLKSNSLLLIKPTLLNITFFRHSSYLLCFKHKFKGLSSYKVKNIQKFINFC